MTPLDPSPKAGSEAAQEEALSGEETSREPGLEKTYAGPRCGYRTRDKRRRPDGAGQEAVYGGNREVVQATKAR